MSSSDSSIASWQTWNVTQDRQGEEWKQTPIVQCFQPGHPDSDRPATTTWPLIGLGDLVISGWLQPSHLDWYPCGTLIFFPCYWGRVNPDHSCCIYACVYLLNTYITNGDSNSSAISFQLSSRQWGHPIYSTWTQVKINRLRLMIFVAFVDILNHKSQNNLFIIQHQWYCKTNKNPVQTVNWFEYTLQYKYGL